MICGPRVRVVSAVAVGSLFLFLGILALTFAPSLIDRAILDQDFLGYEEKNGTRVLNDMTRQWQTPPYDMHLQIYFFNIKNAKEIMKGARPIVEEVGPYTFVEKQSKTFEFTHNDTRVIYKNNHVYYFNESLSCASCLLDRPITIPSIIFQKLVDIAQKGMLYKFAIQAVLTAVSRETAFIEVKAREALFDGYEDPIISSVCNNPVLKFLCDNGSIPKRIGFFYKQNNTDDGSYEIHTGLGEPSDIGKLFSWNNMTSLPNGTWDSPYARMINGSDGQTFPPLIQKGDAFTLFAAQAGRSIFMEYTGVTEFRSVTSYRFTIPSTMFDPAYHNNREFCNKDTPQFFNSTVQIPTCLPKGFLDVGRTQPGSPRAYLSQAHFLDAQKEVVDGIIGMKPANSKNDTTFVDIEPNTGVPIRARRAMQINIGMLKGNLDMLSRMSNMILPVLWMNETITFDEGTRKQLAGLNMAKHISFVGGVGFVVAGATVWIALAAVLLIFTITREQSAGEDYQPIVEEDEEEA